MQSKWLVTAFALGGIALVGCESRTTRIERTVERTSTYPPGEQPQDVKFRKQEYGPGHEEKGGVKVRVNPQTGVDVDIQPKRDK